MAQNRYSVTSFLTSPLVSTKKLHGHLVCAVFYCREGTLRRTACAAPRYALNPFSRSGLTRFCALRDSARRSNGAKPLFRHFVPYESPRLYCSAGTLRRTYTQHRALRGTPFPQSGLTRFCALRNSVRRSNGSKPLFRHCVPCESPRFNIFACPSHVFYFNNSLCVISGNSQPGASRTATEL